MFNKGSLRKTLFSCLLAMSGAVQSTTLSDTKIDRISVYGTDLVFIKTSPPAASTASNCSQFNGEWVVSLSTEHGRAMYAQALSAVSMGKTISIYGGSVGCDLIENRETVVRIDVYY